MKKHLTKLKRTQRFAYIRQLGSQAVQDIAERIDRSYNLFWANLKRKVRTSPPKFKAVRKYRSYTLKQTGWKLDEYLVCDVQCVPVATRTGKSVGVDFGLKKFLTASDGNDIVSPDFFIWNG